MVNKGSFLYKIIFFTFGLIVFSMLLQRSEVQAGTIKNDRISCGKILCGGDVQFYESVECGKEYKVSGSSKNCKLYQKKVWLKKQFKKHIKENTYDIKSEVRQQFTFTYDKAGNVTISPESISQEIVDTGWKISPVSEIYPDESICTVSNKYSVYEKNLVGNYQYIGDGYFDVFCDYNGEIGINSDLR